MRVIPFIATLALLMPIPGIAGEKSDREADFAWFSSLGYPGVEGLSFVRCNVGSAASLNSRGEQELKIWWKYGWLLSEDEKRLKILTLALESEEHAKAGDDGGFELQDFSTYVESELQNSDNAAGRRAVPNRAARNYTKCDYLSSSSRLFILAWMCSRRGLDALAAKAYAAAVGLKPAEHGTDKSETKVDQPLRDQMERDLGELEIWKILSDFANLKITRNELLARASVVPTRFPHCEYLELADRLTTILKRMTEEDDVHAALTEEEIARLPLEEQVKEWIFQLRDENATPISRPGLVNFFDEYYEFTLGPKSPAHHLAALGDAAVPALIATLGDERLTRSVQTGRSDMQMPSYLLSVGDVALATIEYIAARKFEAVEDPEGGAIRGGGINLKREAINAWWQKRQTKGAFGDLSEVAARGDVSSCTAGDKLLRDFPDQAAEPILAGAAAATKEDAISAYIDLVSRMKDERAMAYLLKETREGKFISTRARAARRLAKRGSLEGVEALAEYWKVSEPLDENEIMPRWELIAALATSNSPKAILALADGLQNKTPNCRNRIVEAFSPGGAIEAMMYLGEFSDPREVPKVSSETQSAVEALLAEELKDDGEPWDVRANGFLRGASAAFRRCDLAAYSLVIRWPEKYAFDIHAPFVERERQRLVMLNTYRADHGLATLPLPEVRAVVAPADSDKIAAVLFAGSPLKTPAPVATFLEGVKGRKVDATFCDELRECFLTVCAKVKPRRDQGLEVTAFRENDHRGVTLVVSPAERVLSPKFLKRDWEMDVWVDVGEKTSKSFERLVFESEKRQGEAGETNAAIEKLRALPMEAPFRVRVVIAPAQTIEDEAL